MKTEFTIAEIRAVYRKTYIGGSRSRLEEMIDNMRLEKEDRERPISKFMETCRKSFHTSDATGRFDRFGREERADNVRWMLSDDSRNILNGMNLSGFPAKVRDSVLESGMVSSNQLEYLF